MKIEIEIETCDICHKIIDPEINWNGKDCDIKDNYFNVTEWGGEDRAIYVCEKCSKMLPMATVIDCHKNGEALRKKQDKFIREKFAELYATLQSDLDLL